MRFFFCCKIFFCLAMISMTSMSMEEDPFQHSKTKKKSKIFNYFKSKKKLQLILNLQHLPTEIWQQIASYLAIPDYLHLAGAHRNFKTALENTKIVNDVVSKMHFYKFPIFKNETKPLQTLSDVYSFFGANGEPRVPFERESETFGCPKQFSNLVKYHSWSYYTHALDTDGIVHVWDRSESINSHERRQRLGTMNDVLGNRKIIDIIIDKKRVTVLSSDGEVLAWDHNFVQAFMMAEPQISETKETSLLIGDLKNKKIIAIRSNAKHGLALSTDGEIFLMDYRWINREARQVKGPWKSEKIIDIHVDASHNLVLTESGNFYGWGDNRQYSLGFKKRKIYDYPRAYNKFNKSIIAIKLVNGCYFILNNRGQVFVWGKPTEFLFPDNEPKLFSRIIKRKVKGKNKVVDLKMRGNDVHDLFFSNGTSCTRQTNGIFHIPDDLRLSNNKVPISRYLDDIELQEISWDTDLH
jgi:hypothetical protein